MKHLLNLSFLFKMSTWKFPFWLQSQKVTEMMCLQLRIILHKSWEGYQLKASLSYKASCIQHFPWKYYPKYSILTNEKSYWIPFLFGFPSGKNWLFWAKAKFQLVITFGGLKCNTVIFWGDPSPLSAIM